MAGPLATLLARRLRDTPISSRTPCTPAAFNTYMPDDAARRDLGFTLADRVENIRRVGEVAKLFFDAGMIVLCSFESERRMVRDLVGEDEFIEISVDASLETCARHDPKGSIAAPELERSEISRVSISPTSRRRSRSCISTQSISAHSSLPRRCCGGYTNMPICGP